VDARARWNLARDGAPAAPIGRVFGHDAYFVEQSTFFLSLIPALVLGRPDVVCFADLDFGKLCWHGRRLSGQRFQLPCHEGARPPR
jgi:1,2-diacylglycerol 3-alpha-glucosyltransferase